MSNIWPRPATWLAVWIAVFGSFLASGVLVYTATTTALEGRPPGRATSAVPDVQLASDGIGRARVDIATMTPGESVSGCIQVIHGHDADAQPEVRVHGVSTGRLSEHLALTIRQGASGGGCRAPGELTTVFDGPLVGLGTDYATGSVGRAPMLAPSVVAYPYTLTLGASTPNSAQGTNSSVELRWEVRSESPVR